VPLPVGWGHLHPHVRHVPWSSVISVMVFLGTVAVIHFDFFPATVKLQLLLFSFSYSFKIFQFCSVTVRVIRPAKPTVTCNI